ncbi:LysE family translocator [Planomonospora venezuelensis]|uniref:Threonine/homoserine/homoserine lactone efflux protein n=1 Tax=Planomonospora venezuelensis TaxID=1999 RepID=A0A841CZ45_PLAVE|nr:LysE family translocator [Planomonospora venezuelensis]MBB5963652.1 threonine/homoserine/homoserine lactone efflux protein [Planomonospora venezuelensis]GIN01440.1 lysine transporter LysE [Planomonospora venezuelensis]
MLTTFAVTALVMIMIPGPDQALITRNALAFGRTAGLLTMFGGLIGLAVHATAAAVGLSALLLTSATAFTALKVVGVLYLLWLGVQSLRASRRTAAAATAATAATATAATGLPPERRSPLQHIRNGFLSNVLNPKVALFFVTFLPQFLPTHGNTLGRALLLSAIFAALYVLWFSFYNVVVARIGALLRTPRIRARIEQATGLLLVGFAIRLAWQQP